MILKTLKAPNIYVLPQLRAWAHQPGGDEEQEEGAAPQHPHPQCLKVNREDISSKLLYLIILY